MVWAIQEATKGCTRNHEQGMWWLGRHLGCENVRGGLGVGRDSRTTTHERRQNVPAETAHARQCALHIILSREKNLHVRGKSARADTI